ncbi:HupE/UreJ family protein [Methylomonas methanica]|uniref:HupE/UreJ protein n=1 Tax=Methylomonas methanica (strain DSM 25384 / MC09) TaxID=857087 RepID=G0A2Y3_METMM|nr:HupE/UreJ family protein [Methylomonas methanica]AEG02642.1 hypothetical protein Metme_4292 [Methylomonas methanica MC09]
MGRLSVGYGRGLLGAVLLLQAAWVWAHAPGLSSLDVAVKPARIDVRMTFALQDIEAFAPMDSDLDAEVSDAEREAAKPDIAKLLAGQLRIAVDGEDVAPTGLGQVGFDAENNAHVEFQYAAVPKRRLLVQSTFLQRLAEGHRQYLTVRDADGKVLAEKMLVKQDDGLSLSFAAAADGEPVASAHSTFNTFRDFFKLGVEHIVTGYDHLLFLLALLVVTHGFWQALKIITFFTLAHSLTLALAGLNIVDLLGSFVEPFIAATIIYVGVENIIRGDHPKGRHWLTFGFGLIHGFGFAGALREMEISSGDTGIFLPLLSFNLGIESGQIAVAIVILPMIWWLNNKADIAEKFLKSCSIAVSLMGTYWLLERTVL